MKKRVKENNQFQKNPLEYIFWLKTDFLLLDWSSSFRLISKRV